MSPIFTLGNLATIITVLAATIGTIVTLMKLHKSNVKEIENRAAEQVNIKNSIDNVERDIKRVLCFESKLEKLDRYCAQMDVVYPFIQRIIDTKLSSDGDD